MEIIGPEPACSRCRTAKKMAEKAAEKLSDEGYQVKVTKIKVNAKETISRYGVLTPPAIAINGIVKMMGKVPSMEAIERLIRQAT